MTSSNQSTPGAPKKGTIIAGKYRVGDVLGRGGMGIVMAGDHEVLRQRVAIKLLLPMAAALPGAVERFMREARSASAIQSEHVTRVLDAGVMDDGLPFIVMEHLSGTDLAQVIKTRGPLPVAEATDLILQACEAIAEAHAGGIIHRDLKPSNVFLTARSDGSPLVKVMDFGLSKLIAESDGGPADGSLTATSAVIGSPHYMSPEQFRSFKHVDARTDVWAIGVILYALLSGKRPFDGDSFPDICMAITSETPVPIRAHRPDLPEPYAETLMRCLEKDRTRRVQNVTELALAIAPFGSGGAAISLRRIEKILPNSTAERPDEAPVGPKPEKVGGAHEPPTVKLGGAPPAGPAPTVTKAASTLAGEPDTAGALSTTRPPAMRAKLPKGITFWGIAGVAIAVSGLYWLGPLRGPVAGSSPLSPAEATPAPPPSASPGPVPSPSLGAFPDPSNGPGSPISPEPATVATTVTTASARPTARVGTSASAKNTAAPNVPGPGTAAPANTAKAADTTPPSPTSTTYNRSDLVY